MTRVRQNKQMLFQKEFGPILTRIRPPRPYLWGIKGKWDHLQVISCHGDSLRSKVAFHLDHFYLYKAALVLRLWDFTLWKQHDSAKKLECNWGIKWNFKRFNRYSTDFECLLALLWNFHKHWNISGLLGNKCNSGHKPSIFNQISILKPKNKKISVMLLKWYPSLIFWLFQQNGNLSF